MRFSFFIKDFLLVVQVRLPVAAAELIRTPFTQKSKKASTEVEAYTM
jgi:hypothetical protein